MLEFTTLLTQPAIFSLYLLSPLLGDSGTAQMEATARVLLNVTLICSRAKGVFHTQRLLACYVVSVYLCLYLLLLFDDFIQYTEVFYPFIQLNNLD